MNGLTTQQANCTSVCSIAGQQEGQDQSLIVPVWISSHDNPHYERLTYALLDSQSNATFITENLREELKVDGVESNLLLSTVQEENKVVKCRKLKGLKITYLKREVTIELPKVFTREAIPCKPSRIPKLEVAMQWKHLKVIAKEIMPYREDVKVGLLIGTDCTKAIKPREVIPGSDKDPYGIRTDLEWGIVGRVCISPSSENVGEHVGIWVNRTVIKELNSDQPRLYGNDFVLEFRAKEIFTPSKVKDMFELDFHETIKEKNQQTLSVQDRRFLKIMDQGIHKRV